MTVTVTNPDDCNVRISNYVIIIYKQHASFNPSRGLLKKKSLIHGK